MKNIQKQYLIFGGVIAILAVIGIYFFISGSVSEKSAKEKDSVFEEPAEIIQTADSSVIVTITGKTEGIIEIEGLPDGTEAVEYELSYNTKSGSIEGVFGLIDAEGLSSISEEITFGTCSSGVCRYHEIVGPVGAVFKFNGTYGKRLLEKSFDLK